jgi:hypothetical protein
MRVKFRTYWSILLTLAKSSIFSFRLVQKLQLPSSSFLIFA